MYEQVEKPKENKSKAVANSVGQITDSRPNTRAFLDNRTSCVSQRLQISSSKSNISHHNTASLLANRPIQRSSTETGKVNLPATSSTAATAGGGNQNGTVKLSKAKKIALRDNLHEDYKVLFLNVKNDDDVKYIRTLKLEDKDFKHISELIEQWFVSDLIDLNGLVDLKLPILQKAIKEGNEIIGYAGMLTSQYRSKLAGISDDKIRELPQGTQLRSASKQLAKDNGIPGAESEIEDRFRLLNQKNNVPQEENKVATDSKEERKKDLIRTNDTEIKLIKEKVKKARTKEGQGSYDAGSNPNMNCMGGKGGTYGPLELEMGKTTDGFKINEVTTNKLESSDKGEGGLKIRIPHSGHKDILVHIAAGKTK
ncbi:MAG: hypothetical protein HRT71_00250 [Flavobacteriales bacterium]|nr:hypothetical protein [Flavobacteriales bacterium]